jgi:rubredoxin
MLSTLSFGIRIHDLSYFFVINTSGCAIFVTVVQGFIMFSSNIEMEEQHGLSQNIYNCPYCNSPAKFKYFNNKKKDQPRHECIECKHLFQPNKHRAQHPQGYKKHEGRVEPLEFVNRHKVCPNCGNDKNIKFMGFNNAKHEQPRYRCNGGCKKPFSPFKKRKLHQEQNFSHQSVGNQQKVSGNSEKSVGNQESTWNLEKRAENQEIVESIGRQESISSLGKSAVKLEKKYKDLDVSGFFPPLWFCLM